MSNLVKINNTELGIKEFNGQRVITFKDIDRVHNRIDGMARKAFNRSKKHLVHYEDYFVHKMDEAKRLFNVTAPNGLITVTESGYLMIAKSLTDDLSWKVQRQLVNTYFKAKEMSNTITDTSQITSAISTLADTMNTLTQNINVMHQDISDLKQSKQNRYLLETQYPSAWYKKMAPKYKMLMEYFDCTRKELYSSIYKELEDTYDVDINQIYEDYCYENRLSKDQCYPMDAIEHNTRLREAVTLLIDSSLVKYGLQTEKQVRNFKRETLFDRVPA